MFVAVVVAAFVVVKGLGKTVQVAALLGGLAHSGLLRQPALIVCPATVIAHWVRELQTWWPPLRVIVLHESGAALRSRAKPSRATVVKAASVCASVLVTTYEGLRLDARALQSVSWGYAILDEGHRVRNPDAAVSAAAKALHTVHRLILTGAPIQNRLRELWSLFDFLMPGFLGTERQFNERYSKPILASRDAKASTKEQEAGTLALDALHRQVLPFLLRRMKEDVLNDLPPKIIQDYYSDLSEIQRVLYEDFSRTRAMSDAVGTVRGADAKNAGATHVFQALQYLRKLVNHPALVMSPQHPEYNKVEAMLTKSKSNLRDLQHAPKLLALQELLLDCGIGGGSPGTADEGPVVASHRALIFCQLKPMLDIIESDLFNNLAAWTVVNSVMEVRVPWMALGFADPSQNVASRHGVGAPGS